MAQKRSVWKNILKIHRAGLFVITTEGKKNIVTTPFYTDQNILFSTLRINILHINTNALMRSFNLIVF